MASTIKRSSLNSIVSIGFTLGIGRAGVYRFSFNGQEKVDEVAGDENTMTATFWEYDARLGRR